MRNAICLLVLLAAGLLAGCARFEARPLSAGQNADLFEERSLTNTGLKAFLETNALGGAWPLEAWDLRALTLAALYYHPDMDVARAKWEMAVAANLTAGQRPNPNLSFTPRLNSTSIGTGVTPWILSTDLDVPLETAGKRKYRIAQAEHLGEAARFELANTAWKVRNRVRLTLLDLQAAQETAALLREQADALGRMAGLVERQWAAGEVSPVDLAAARVAFQNVQLKVADARRQAAEARVLLAGALGVPARALEGVRVVYSDPTVFPTNLSTADVRRQAALNRADLLRALAEYAASESALQLQIAKQYPDIHLRPGYELDQDENKWTLGVSVDLPVLNQNQGPIAEAKARREETAAAFNALQARVLGEIDRASASYFAAAEQATAAEGMVAELRKRSQALSRMFEAGATDKLSVTSAQAEYLGGAAARLNACLLAQRALAALEDAVQSPLSMPLEVDRWSAGAMRAAERSNP